MSFCKNGLTPVKNFLSHLTEGIETAVTAATAFTGKLKNLNDSPSVQEVESIVGDVLHVDIVGGVNKAFTIITGIESTVETLAEKLSAWLAGDNSLAKNMKLIKLASVTASVNSVAAGEEQKPESFYDTAVQIHSITNPAVIG